MYLADREGVLKNVNKIYSCQFRKVKFLFNIILSLLIFIYIYFLFFVSLKFIQKDVVYIYEKNNKKDEEISDEIITLCIVRE